MVYTYAEEIALRELDSCIISRGQRQMTFISMKVLRHLVEAMAGNENKTKYELMWEKKREKYESIREAKKVLLIAVGKTVQVVAPYNKVFMDAAIDMGGVWKPRTRVWSFHKKTREQILTLCKAHYPASAFEV